MTRSLGHRQAHTTIITGCILRARGREESERKYAYVRFKRHRLSTNNNGKPVFVLYAAVSKESLFDNTREKQFGTVGTTGLISLLMTTIIMKMWGSTRRLSEKRLSLWRGGRERRRKGCWYRSCHGCLCHCSAIRIVSYVNVQARPSSLFNNTGDHLCVLPPSTTHPRMSTNR